jgi:hypothetical protein
MSVICETMRSTEPVVLKSAVASSAMPPTVAAEFFAANSGNTPGQSLWGDALTNSPRTISISSLPAWFTKLDRSDSAFWPTWLARPYMIVSQITSGESTRGWWP